MPNEPPKNKDIIPQESGKSYLERASGTFKSNKGLQKFLTEKELASLSVASKKTRDMTADDRIKQALDKLFEAVEANDTKLINKIITSRPEFLLDRTVPSAAMAFCTKDSTDKIVNSKKAKLLNNSYLLLSAVVTGNEYFAKKIIEAHPELLLDASATVTDLSGKQIQGLTPVQAAICAGDVEMVQMMKEVVADLDVAGQFMAIYSLGDMDSLAQAQQDAAQEFKKTKLRAICTAISTATNEQVRLELLTPGQRTASALNAALHTFRDEFTDTSNKEQIFNPYYLLEAYKYYEEQIRNFIDWNQRDLFWWQVVGYIQRHLPACYLQAFAQGLRFIHDGYQKLERDFEFSVDQGFYMRGRFGDLDNLGYKYFVGGWVGEGGERCQDALVAVDSEGEVYCFKNYCEQKNQVWRTYLRRELETRPGA